MKVDGPRMIGTGMDVGGFIPSVRILKILSAPWSIKKRRHRSTGFPICFQPSVFRLDTIVFCLLS